MGDKTGIEWTDATWNPIRARNRESGQIGWHCEHVSEGCRNCYAERINRHPRSAFTGTAIPFKPGHRADVEVYLDEKGLLQPLRWGRPRMIFVCSMTDLFADFVPDAMIDRIFAIMALCPQHIFQVLTKRPARMLAYVSSRGVEDRLDAVINEIAPEHWCSRELQDYGGWPLQNVWLGVSCEDHATADARIPELLATPAAVRFVSAEPLLGPINFEEAWHGETALDSECWGDCSWCKKGHPPLHNCQKGLGDWEKDRSGLDWIIVGGESGPNARPMHPDWARTIRDQCASASIPFHFKQWGEFREFGTGFPIVEVVCDDSAAADAVLWAATRPSWITLAGRHVLCRADLPDDGTPCRLIERVGKTTAGRLLDGVEHNGLPAALKASEP